MCGMIRSSQIILTWALAVKVYVFFGMVFLVIFHSMV